MVALYGEAFRLWRMFRRVFAHLTVTEDRFSTSPAHNLERYRSGHNEAVLKTVWAKAHKGSNPFLSAIFVVRKSYKIKKAQDLVGLVLFCCYILCFVSFAEYLNSGAAFQHFFQKRGFEPLSF